MDIFKYLQPKHEQISFLLEALGHLKIDDRKDDKVLALKEHELVDKIYYRLVNNILVNGNDLSTFHPFNLSKIFTPFGAIIYEKESPSFFFPL